MDWMVKQLPRPRAGAAQAAICFGAQLALSAGIDDYADEDEVVRCAMLHTLTALDFLSSQRTDAADDAPAEHP